MKKLLFVFMLSLLMIGMAWGQVTFFSESFGTVSSTTAISTHEANNGFDVDSATYSGTAELRTTTASSIYTGASGGANVFFTNTVDRYLLIEGIDSSGYTDISMSLGHYKNTTTGNNELDIEVSSDGVTWSQLTYSRPTGTGTAAWILINPSGDIPAASNLRVKFTQTSSSHQFRIDDLQLSGTLAGGTPIADTPTFAPNGGYFINSVNVTLSSTTDSATIYYTLDGNTPGDNSTEYTENIVLTATTTIKAIAYAPDHDPSTVAEATFTKLEPATTTIPYTEDFDSGWGDTYTYTVSGIKPWYISSNSATANGYNGSFPEEHWLVLPGINFDAYTNERMSFDTYVQYGAIDENNYLKLFYSADYPGLGDPTGSTWTEIDFVQATSGSVGSTELSAFSGVLDISDIVGEQVYLAFKYYANDNPSSWKVDNISIYIAVSVVTINEALTDFSYFHNAGPSDEQSFTLNGVDLVGNIIVTAPTNYEISLSADSGYTNEITLNSIDGTVAETTIYVRLKAGLDIGVYNENITISSQGTTDQTVSLPGQVLPPPPSLTDVAYTENFSGFVSYETLPNGWSVSNTSYAGDWGSGISAGLRGNASVLGFQHTQGTGVFTAELSLINGTGSTLSSLQIDYTGKVERTGEGRSPIWTVKLDGDVINNLEYSTSSGEDQDLSATIENLNIAPGQVFVISWSSDRGESTGASKQIGISNVVVSRVIYDYPEGTAVPIDGGSITFTQGSANVSTEAPPAWNNADLASGDAVVLSFNLQGFGPWTIQVASDAPYCAYYDAGAWHLADPSVDGVYTIVITGYTKGPIMHIVLSNLDPTLPVELSSFTAVLTSTNSALLTWITASESGVLGYYILRGDSAEAPELTVSGLIEAVNSSQTQTYKFEDSSLFETGSYYYWLQSVDYDGTESFFGPVELVYAHDGSEGEVPGVEIVTALQGAYPNPFNPSTNIAYSLSETCDVEFRIFNSRGQMIRHIKVGQKEAGKHSQVWNGVDANGNVVGSGIYYIRMQAGSQSFSSKAVLMK